MFGYKVFCDICSVNRASKKKSTKSVKICSKCFEKKAQSDVSRAIKDIVQTSKNEGIDPVEKWNRFNNSIGGMLGPFPVK